MQDRLHSENPFYPHTTYIYSLVLRATRSGGDAKVDITNIVLLHVARGGKELLKITTIHRCRRGDYPIEVVFMSPVLSRC